MMYFLVINIIAIELFFKIDIFIFAVGSPSFSLDSVVNQSTNPNMSPIECGSWCLFLTS